MRLSPPKPDWIRVKAPNSRGYADTRAIVKENGLVTVCEEAGLPEYRRMLGQEARHLHDHGRHLHPRLRLLQRQDRHARRARSVRAGARRAKPSPSSGSPMS